MMFEDGRSERCLARASVLSLVEEVLLCWSGWMYERLWSIWSIWRMIRYTPLKTAVMVYSYNISFRFLAIKITAVINRYTLYWFQQSYGGSHAIKLPILYTNHACRIAFLFDSKLLNAPSDLSNVSSLGAQNR